MTAPRLEVEGLRVRFGAQEVVRGVSFGLARERLALVGGSGAGKSLIARAILRLLPPGARMSADRLAFAGTDILRLEKRGLRALRGGRIGLILQDAKFSLDPMMTVGAQIVECCRAHGGAGGGAARRQALAMLAAVRFEDPERIYHLYPHQLSGGMGQRAMIAMMLAPEPELLIADECTAALDAVSAVQVLAVLDDLVRRRGMGVLFISHDLDLVRGFCDRVLVLEAGCVVERLGATDLAAARHPYTQRLLAARPQPVQPP